MRFLGLDFGSKRIGVAVSDEEGIIAQPWTVLTRKGGARDLDRIAHLVDDLHAQAVIIGLPLNMDQTEGPAAAKVRRFAQLLQQRLLLPVTLWDERLTTWEAEGLLIESRIKPKKRREVIDKVAAALILKSYLDAHRRGEPSS